MKCQALLSLKKKKKKKIKVSSATALQGLTYMQAVKPQHAHLHCGLSALMDYAHYKDYILTQLYMREKICLLFLYVSLAELRFNVPVNNISGMLRPGLQNSANITLDE